MKKLICQGDSTSHGGKVLTGSDRFMINGRRAARLHDQVSCPVHGDNEIVEGNSRILDGGLQIAVDGARTQCGALLIASSDTVKVD